MIFFMKKERKINTIIKYPTIKLPLMSVSNTHYNDALSKNNTRVFYNHIVIHGSEVIIESAWLMVILQNFSGAIFPIEMV